MFRVVKFCAVNLVPFLSLLTSTEHRVFKYVTVLVPIVYGLVVIGIYVGLGLGIEFELPVYPQFSPCYEFCTGRSF
jgi:hypothetical protein